MPDGCDAAALVASTAIDAAVAEARIDLRR